MPGARGGFRGCPCGPQTPNEENSPSESRKHPPRLCSDAPPGQAATERQQPEIGVPAFTPAPGEPHPLRFLTSCIPSNPVLAGDCSPAPSLLIIHSPLLGSPER